MTQMISIHNIQISFPGNLPEQFLPYPIRLGICSHKPDPCPHSSLPDMDRCIDPAYFHCMARTVCDWSRCATPRINLLPSAAAIPGTSICAASSCIHATHSPASEHRPCTGIRTAGRCHDCRNPLLLCLCAGCGIDHHDVRTRSAANHRCFTLMSYSFRWFIRQIHPILPMVNSNSQNIQPNINMDVYAKCQHPGQSPLQPYSTSKSVSS